MKIDKDKDGYPCAPVMVNSSQWFYEQKAGLEIYAGPDGAKVRIPWRNLCGAVDRHRKVSRSRKI